MSLADEAAATMKAAGAEILRLRSACETKDSALDKAKEKLAIYRKQVSGEYQGGMEYAMLVRAIEEARVL